MRPSTVPMRPSPRHASPTSLSLSLFLSLSRAPLRCSVTMPLRHRRTSGCCGVRVRPSDTFYTEIRSGDMRLGLLHVQHCREADHAYDEAAWRLNRPCRDMNFPEMMTQEWAQRLAPPRGLSPKRTVARTRGGSAASVSPKWTNMS